MIVLEHLSLDGVIQGPGGPDEDTSGGFTQGGWIGPYSDSLLATALGSQMNALFDLLLGRKTYDIWAPYWPRHGELWPQANAAKKYVASLTLTEGPWHPTEISGSNLVARVRELKQQPGPDLRVWGSGNLVETLLEHHLVDVLWLMLYPVTLGTGKRLFAQGATPAGYRLKQVTATTKGVLLVTYESDKGR